MGLFKIAKKVAGVVLPVAALSASNTVSPKQALELVLKNQRISIITFVVQLLAPALDLAFDKIGTKVRLQPENEAELKKIILQEFELRLYKYFDELVSRIVK